METPHWCTVLVHQYGHQISTKDLKVTFSFEKLFLSFRELAYVHINSCIFEMKHAMGLETCTKIYFLFNFNLV